MKHYGALVLTIVLSGCGSVPVWTNGEVPFVRSTPEVIDRMLELARVQSADVVYDIGSGDGAFVGLVEGLTSAGRRVDVVSRPSSLSRRLARAATVVVPLPEPLHSPPPFAVAA